MTTGQAALLDGQDTVIYTDPYNCPRGLLCAVEAVVEHPDGLVYIVLAKGPGCCNGYHAMPMFVEPSLRTYNRILGEAERWE